MATATTELEVIIKAKDQASATLKDISKKAGEIGKTFAIAGGAIAGALGFAVAQATDAQTKIANLDAVLRTMGDAALANRDAIIKASQATVALGFDDEAAALSIGKLFQRTGDLNEAINLNALAMDIARFKHIDLETASKAVTLALSGSGKLFKELGISTKDAGEPMELLAEAQAKVAGQAQAFASTVPGQMATLKESFNNVAQGIGEVLLPIISKVIDKLVPIIDKMIEWTETHPELTKNIVIATAALGALLLGLAPLLLLISAISPAFIALAGVVAILAGGIFLLTTHWEQVRNAIEPFLVKMRELASVALDFLKPAIDFLIISLVELWGKFRVLWELLAPLLKPILEFLGFFLGSTLVGVIAVAIVSLGLLATMISTLIDWFKIFNEWLGKLALFFTDILPAALSGLQQAWANTWDNIRSKFESVFNFVQGKIDALIGAWNKAQALVTAPLRGAISSVKGGISNVISSITGKQEGGSVEAGKTFLVGERGAELFTPLRSGFITPNSQIAGGGSITVNINGGTYLSERIALEIGDMIVNRLKMVSKIRV